MIYFSQRLMPQRVPSGEIPRLPVSAPESEGVSSSGILNFLDRMEKYTWRQCEIQGFALMKNGKLIAESYRAPYTEHTRRGVASITKGFTCVAMGFLLQDGLVDLDERVIDVFPDRLPSPLPPNAELLTVRHLLQMRTGQTACAADAMLASSDPVRGFFDQPFEHAPGGDCFKYNSGASNLLSHIVTRRTGETLAAYLERKLFRHIGFGAYQWDVDSTGANYGGWGIAVTARQMAMLGQFVASRGAWNGERLLFEKWFDLMPQNPAPTINLHIPQLADWNYGYGLHVWLNHVHGTFRYDGAGGHYILMFPGENAALAVSTRASDFGYLMDAMWDYLHPALKGWPLPQQLNAQALLQKRLAGLSAPLPRHTTGGFPSKVAAKFASGDGEITGFDLAFDVDTAELSLNGEPPARFGVNRWLFNPREEGRTLLEGEFFGNASLTPEGELKLLFRSSEVVYMIEFTIKFEAGAPTLVVDNGEEVRTFSEAQK